MSGCRLHRICLFRLFLAGVLLAGSLAGCAADAPQTDSDLTVDAVAAAPRTGQPPLDVSFSVQATSSDEPISVQWSFGDGGSGSGLEVAHTYTQTGEYTAQATVTDTAGGSYTESVVIAVESPDVPVVTATATPDAGIAPLDVSFGAQVNGGSGDYAFAWDFGDGTTGEGKTPSHQFGSAGTYDATVEVTDLTTDVTSDVASVQVQVADNQTPVASASASPSTGIVPLPVSFSGSVVGGNEPFSYAWTFGDDSATADAKSPSHEYVTPGTYTAIFEVTDADGQTSTANVQIEVSDNSAPVTALSATPDSGVAPVTVQFDPHVQGGDAPLSFAWDFGDGQSDTAPLPTHTYEDAGDYSATVTVTDANGDEATDTIAITATDNTTPTVDPTATPESGLAPLRVQFGTNATGGDQPLSYQWNFGDNATATTANPVHTFDDAGDYTVSVTATDANGDAASDELVISVGDDRTPSANASATPDEGYAPLDVNFFGNATGGNAPLTYAWTFGDGSTSADQNPTHTYDSAGSYTATLIVTDDNGDTDDSAMTISVADNSVPQVSASASPDSGIAPHEVTFQAGISNGDAPFSYDWNFGDGSAVEHGANPTHIYTDGDTYTATVTVTDNNGDTGSDTVSVQVASNTQPGVEASADPDTGAAPLAVQFSADATGGNGSLTYEWFFGDGTAPVVGQQVTHTFNNIGVYDVDVVVTDADGDTAQDTIEINALDTAPDLAVQSIDVQVNQADIEYNVVLINQGTDDISSSFYLDFFNDLDSPPQSVASLEHSEYVTDGLAAGQTLTITHTESDLADGDYTPYVWANSFEDIPDLDRTNNIAAGPAFSIEVLLINEVLYRTAGSDTGTFIELYGTAGLDVSSYTLAAVNGSNGDTYASYDVPAGTTIPADGYLVIGDGSAAQQDLTTSFVDLQNGADSLVVEAPDGSVVDALGYGDFSAAPSNFAGEAAATDNVSDDYSVGRDLDHSDTNDNQSDFYAWRVPTPGAANRVTLTNGADVCADAYSVSDGAAGRFVIDGDIGGLSNDFTSLASDSPASCDPINQDLGGPDQVFSFTVPPGQTADVTVELDDNSPSYNIGSVLTGAPCMSLDDGIVGCVYYSSNSFDGLAAGTYYVAVFLNSATDTAEASEPYQYTVDIELN